MRRTVAESTVLFLSIIKWVFLATIAGLIVGTAVSFFLKILNWSTGLGAQISGFFWFLPVALFVSSLMVKYFAPDAKGHGTEKVIEAIHKRDGKIPFAVVPVKVLATLITLAAGGSVGKEGPCAQIGAGIMAVELFGPAIAPYAALSCVISFLITGHRSVYPSQVLSVSKSPSLQVEVGKEIEEIQTTLNLRKKSFITRALLLMKKMENIVYKIYRADIDRRDARNNENTDSRQGK